MEGLFVRLRQGLCKHKKKLLYGALFLFIGQICFFNLGNLGINSVVYAAEGETPSESKSLTTLVQEKTALVSFFEKVLYITVYPLLFLAGKLVDNSFVYGENFGFDAVLWKLWNIVRNLANYGLGFIFVYYIFKYLIKKDEKYGPKWLIIRALIAGVGIQATWFAMGVLIDISSILTYSVGGLPLSVLQDESVNNEDPGGSEKQSNEYNPYILKTIVSMDGDDIAEPNIYMATIKDAGQIGEEIISECVTFKYQKDDIKEELILAPKMIYYQRSDKEFLSTMKNVCHYYGQIYWFKELHEKIQWKTCDKEGKDCKDNQIEYAGGDADHGLAKLAVELSAIEKEDMKSFIEKGIILERGNAHVVGGVYGGAGLAENSGFNIVLDENKCGGSDGDNRCGFDVDNNWIGSGKTLRLSDLINSDETSHSYVTVFSSLYASLLNSGRSVFAVSEDGVYVKFLRALLTFGTMVAIAIPLVVAALVFLMRIAIIWIAIVLSPAIVLVTVFDFKIGDKDFLSYFKLGNLIGIIFSPAVVCFAISMSLVFVKIIERINSSEIATVPLTILGTIQVDLAGFTVGLGQLIIVFMGIAITWFLVWAAVKASKLGEKGGIIDNLYNLANSAIGSVPIVPVPTRKSDGSLGMGMVGANSAFGLNGYKSALDQGIYKLKSDFDREENNAVQELINPSKATGRGGGVPGGGGVDAAKDLYSMYNSHLLNDSAAINGDWTVHEFDLGNNQKCKFGNLTLNYQKQIIEDINGIANADIRKKFGNATPIVTVGTGDETIVYEFNTNESKYQAKP